MAKSVVKDAATLAVTLAVVVFLLWGVRAVLASFNKEGVTTTRKSLTYTIAVMPKRGRSSVHTVTIKDAIIAWSILFGAHQSGSALTASSFAKLVAAKLALDRMVPRNLLLDDSTGNLVRYELFKWAVRTINKPPSNISSYTVVSAS